MNNEKQRIAIAEACGYKRLTQHEAVWSHKGSKIYTAGNLPDYLNDLNAMHEAEETLGDCEMVWGKYAGKLFSIMEPHRHYLHATAAQRAEALLRTIGKWQD